MACTALKFSKVLSVLELLVLFFGGSIFASFMISTELLVLFAVTIGWLLIVFLENVALNCASATFVTVIGVFRLLGLTGICVVPIILAPYYSEDSGPYLAIFGGIGVLFNPIKGLVLLKTARNMKNAQEGDSLSLKYDEDVKIKYEDGSNRMSEIL